MLGASGWFQKISGGRKTPAIISPLSRCLQTALLVLEGLPITYTVVEENIRETLGEDTCDARRSKSEPTSETEGPCDYRHGLEHLYPEFEFPVVDEQYRDKVRQNPGVGKKDKKGQDKGSGLGFGLFGDQDLMWTKNREVQKHQVCIRGSQ
jgi:hypothetical protein